MQQYGLKITSPFEKIDTEVIEVSSPLVAETIYNEHTQAHRKYVVVAPVELTIITKIDASGDAVIDILDSVEIKHNDAKVTLVCKGIAKDNAKIIYRSDLNADASIKGSVAHQKASFLTLGDQVEIDAIPSLNIATSSIVCSHSLSVSDMDATALWYAGLHGADESGARDQLKEAFLA